jgi:RNA polymerase sigma-70 factor (ECF subfamily)
MFSKTASCGSLWDFSVVEAVAENQRWILTAMHRHGRGLVTMLWRILGNEQDVCDAYQDTFLKLAHHEGGRKPKHVRAYIFRTANNIAVSILRRRISEKRNLAESVACRKPSKSPAAELDAKLLRDSLRDCIAQLPEHLRDVVVLRDLGELSYPQISQVLGISAGTARVYRCKAIQLLAVWMNKEQ